MNLLDNITADNIFKAIQNRQYGLETLSNQMLKAGIDKYQEKDYKGAAREFEKSINLAPFSTYAPNTAKYLVQSYIKIGEEKGEKELYKQKVIQTYKNAIQRHPKRDDLRTELGNYYFSNEMYQEAVIEYKAAVDAKPDAKNRFSLGQGYLKTQDYNEAFKQFNEVKRLEPNSPNGYYGMGQLYSKTQDYDQAIEEFEKMITKDSTFYEAYAQMGYAYADGGNIDDAWKMHKILEKKDETLAQMLKLYIDKVDPPKITFAWASGSFPYRMSINTPVSALDSYLEGAGTSMSMTMKFMFSKEMDRSSVENIANWSISRASGYGANAYNFSMAIPDTETSLNPLPDYVIYNKENMSATVGFTISQNENADATIDPSHIVFKFKGKDIYDIAMDKDFDEFSGFNKIA